VAPSLNDLLASFPADIRKIVREARKTLRDAVPNPVETVDRENIGIGLGEGYAGLIFTLTPYKDHVNLGIFDGARLPDPAGLLQGAGKRHRHVKLRQVGDLSSPALRRLVADAVKMKRGEAGRAPKRRA
jgi:hypothetical protein